MRLKWLHLKNFGLYKDQYIDFSKLPRDSAIGIVGINLDSIGASSNGSGKTMLAACALSFCYFGKTFRISDDVSAIIRAGEKQCSVASCVERADSSEVVVTRVRQLSGSVSVGIEIISKDGSVIESYKDLKVKDAQNIIADLFGFNKRDPFTDFTNLVIFASSAVKSFSSETLGPSDYFEIISRFLNLAVFEAARGFAKEDADRLNNELVRVEGTIDVLNERVNGIDPESLKEQQKTFTAELARAEKHYTQILDGMQILFDGRQRFLKVIDAISESVKTNQAYTTEINQLVAQYEDAKSNFDLNTFDELKRRREKLLVSLDEFNAKNVVQQKTYSDYLESSSQKENSKWHEVKELNDRVISLTGQLKNDGSMNVCPVCNTTLWVGTNGEFHKFDEESHKEIMSARLNADAELAKSNIELEELKSAITETSPALLEKIEEVSTQIVSANSEMSDIARKIGRMTEQQNVFASHSQLIEQKRKAHAAYRKTVQIDIDGLISEFTKWCSPFSNVFDFEINWDTTMQKFDDKKFLFQKMKEEDSVAIASAKAECEQLSEKLSSYNDASSRLKKAINLQKELQEAHENAKYWVEMFPKISKGLVSDFLPLFELTTNKILERLEVNERIMVEVGGGKKKAFSINVSSGAAIRGLRALSTGERARISIAIGFALREIAGLGNRGGTPNFLVVDELLDRIDPCGVGLFFKMLEDIPGLKFILSHRASSDVGELVDHVLTIKRQNNTAYISME